MERSLAFVALLVLCSFATLTSGAATHEGDRRGSFFHSGEYDEHIEVAKLTLKAATQCNYNTPTNDDLNYLTCAPDEDPYHKRQEPFVPFDTDASRVGLCSINYLGGFPADTTDNLYIGDFIANCHINNDELCADSLGCSNLDISVSGLSYELYDKEVLTVEPKLITPPDGPGCLCLDCGRVGDTRQRGGSKRGHNNNTATTKQPRTPAPGHMEARVLSAYGHDGRLPDTVWVRDPNYSGYVYPVVVYSGQAFVFDRHTKQQVGTGWLDYVQVYVVDRLTNDGWVEIPSSQMPTGSVVIRDPYKYKFTFTKEVKHAPYAN